MVIYISGGMTDVKDYKRRFKVAEVKLRKQYPEATIINPANIVGLPKMDWGDHLMIDLTMLKYCTHIYLLDDWDKSKGSRIELDYAKKIGIESIYTWEM